jgi:hypothetical protein
MYDLRDHTTTAKARAASKKAMDSDRWFFNQNLAHALGCFET